MDEIKIYLMRHPYRGKPVFKEYSPGESSRWGNIVSIDNIEEADYVIICDHPPPFKINFPPEKIIYIKAEPMEFKYVHHYYANVDPVSHVFRDSCCGKNGVYWDIRKNYDELKRMNCFPEKTKNLSAIISNVGDGTQAPEIEILEGHRLRWNFLMRFLNKYPDNIIDWWGKRIERYMVPSNHGSLIDKWDGLKDYRYTFAFENSSQNGYFTEKITDAVLTGTMAIYWGCPDLEDYLPKGSFIRLDIAAEDAPEKAMDIVHSDYRERHLDELKEAKKRILDEYNYWPTYCRIINEINNAQH